ncbi:hypothetical protein JCM10207_007842 [Rhodosporidiobolus poonsookiae]
MSPSLSLSDLAALHQHHSHHSSPAAAAATEEQASHLSLLSHQRTLAVLRLDRALCSFSAAQTPLSRQVDHLQVRVEDELAVAAHSAAGAGEKEEKGEAAALRAKVRLAREDAARAVEEGYEHALGRFERAWGVASKLERRWEVVCPVVRTGEGARVRTWVDDAPGQADSVLEFLRRVVREDPYVLGSGLAMLPDLSLLLSPSPSSTPSAILRPDAPLHTLLRFLASASPSGPRAALALVQGLCETAIRELVGRERGGGGGVREGVEGEGGIGLGIAMSREGEGGGEMLGGRFRRRKSARESELEGFLVGVLETLDDLDLVVEGQGLPNPDPSQPAPLGALAFTQPAVEDLLLTYLHAGAVLRCAPSAVDPVSPPPLASPSASPALSADAWSPSAFLTSSFSTLTAVPGAAFRGVTSAASSLSLNAFGLPSPPLTSASSSPSTPTPRTPRPSAAETSPQTPGSPSSPNKPLPRRPAFLPSPSPSFSLSPPARAPLSPQARRTLRTAASLLHLLRAASSSSPEPLISRLLRTLLATSFPHTGPARQLTEHRKAAHLALVRWWAFKRLGRFLRAPGAFLPSFCATALVLPLAPDARPPLAAERRAEAESSARSFLEGVALPAAAKADLLAPLHKAVYGAVTAACTATGSGAVEDDEEEGDEPEERALRAAARAWVDAWCVEPSSSPQEKGSASGEAKAVSLTRAEVDALVQAVGEVVFPSLGVKEGQALRAALSGEQAEEDGEEGEEAVLFVHRREGQVVVGWEMPQPPPPPPPPAPTPDNSTALASLTASQLSTVRCAVHSLVSDPALARLCHLPSSPPSTDADADLLSALSRASSLSLSRGSYAAHLLFSHAHALLLPLVSSPSASSASLTPALLAPLAAPLLLSISRAASALALAQARLAALSTHLRTVLSPAAQLALSRLAALRRRAWAAQALVSPLGGQLRARLAALAQTGADEAEDEVRVWRAEVGALDVLGSAGLGDGAGEGEGGESKVRTDEALMLLETVSALAVEPDVLGATPLFAREAALLFGPPSSAEGEGGANAGLASTLLAVPGALWSAIPQAPFLVPPSPRAAQEGVAAGDGDEEALVFVPGCGAVSASLATVFQDASSSSSQPGIGDADDFLVCLSSSLAASLHSFLSSPFSPTPVTALFPRASPLPHTAPTSSGSESFPPFIHDLIRRAILHPSSTSKLAALVELERALVALADAGLVPLAPAPQPARPPAAAVAVDIEATLAQRRHRPSPSAGSATLQRLFLAPPSVAYSTASSAVSTTSGSPPSSASPRRATFNLALEGGDAGATLGGSWRRRSRRLSLSLSAAGSGWSTSGSSTGWRSPQRSPLSAVFPFAAPPRAAAGPTTTDDVLLLLERALSSCLSPNPSFTSPPQLSLRDLLEALHALAALSPALVDRPTVEAKAFSDTVVAGVSLWRESSTAGRAEGEGGVAEKREKEG